jgi:arabinan endo-1,5-alpha-L-arabinosidase
MVSFNPLRLSLSRLAALAALSVAAATATIIGCSSGTSSAVPAGNTGQATNPLSYYNLLGNVNLVHDPTIIRQGSTYYVLSTDSGSQTGYLSILCSTDKITWTTCGHVFNTIPAAVTATAGLSGVTGLWAPDVSYFNNLYHVYWVASVFGTNTSVIGLATSPTMNPSDPNYKWTDQGIILQSTSSSPFNAIDPNILIDASNNVWMDFGSFFGGIYQYAINPTTGQLSSPGSSPTLLAARPAVSGNPIEGASMVLHNGYYYLFVSFGYCCNTPFTTDTYQIAVGRGNSPNGPFLDQNGTNMLNGGGTILLSSEGEFTAPGGEDVIVDSANGDLITFHALSNNQNGLDYLFVKSLTWPNDWPVIGN